MSARSFPSLRLSHRGFSLIEAAIVLGIVGLVIGGIWVAASAVAMNLKVSRSVEGIRMIVTNVQKTVSRADATQMGGADLTTMLISARLLPADWVLNANDGVTPFGNKLHVVNADPSGGLRFDIVLGAGLNKSQCLRLLRAIPQNTSKDWAHGVETGGLVALINNGSGWNTTVFPTIIPSSACDESGNQLFITYGYVRNG